MAAPQQIMVAEKIAAGGGGGIAFVTSSNTGNSSAGSSVASIAPAGGITVSAGDTIVVACGIYGQTFRGTVADGTNTYTLRKSHTEVSGIGIFTAPCAGGGTFTPTYTCGGANAPLSVGVGAFSGMLDPAAPEANGQNGDISVGPATLSSALTLTDARLILSGVVLGSSGARTISTPGGYTRLYAFENDGSGSAQMCFDYKILVAGGSENPSHTLSGATWWAIIAATFEPA